MFATCHRSAREGWLANPPSRLALRRTSWSWFTNRSSPRSSIGERRLERETGIEPATNSLEGCDSTTELLPPSRPMRFAQPSHSPWLAHRSSHLNEGWWGGEGSNLRSPKAAGLQPAAIDRSATSPISLFCSKTGYSRAPCLGLSRPSLSSVFWSPCVRRS